MSNVIDRIGLVINTLDDNTAEVMAEKKSACGGCQDTHKCKTCLIGSDKIIAVVINDTDAAAGDVVKLEQKRDALLGGAALFYTLPVFTLLAGAFSGGALAPGLGIGESTGAILLGLAGLAIGLLSVVWFARTEFARLRLVPHIVGIVESAAKERGKSAPPSPSAYGESSRACCS